MSRRLLIYLTLLPGLLLLSIGTLAFAHAYANIGGGQRCFPEFLHAQWPKWIGCAMAAHENLAGGLIGGCGALLAAIIAADAVWQQITDSRSQIAQAEQRRAVLEMDAFYRVREYYDRLLEPFRKAMGAEDIKYINGIDALYKSGNLVPFFGPLPEDHRALARDIWERLSNLNFALTESRKIGNSGTGDLKTRTEINNSIAKLVGSIELCRKLADDLIRHSS